MGSFSAMGDGKPKLWVQACFCKHLRFREGIFPPFFFLSYFFFFPHFFLLNFRIVETFRLEETSEIIKPNC